MASSPDRSQRSASKAWTALTVEELQAALPQYEILEMLGRGGMGAVYKARQRSLKRLVAIKVLPLGAAGDELRFLERFRHEAETLAQMNHPAIVNVYDFGETPAGLLYFVMEFVDGTDVHQMIQSSGRLSPEHALSIAAHVCDSLAYAHRRGVIHRDIKPANILIDREGCVKVADFGLAKMHDPAQTSALTLTNMTMGTPDYAAPEVFKPGVVADHRADLYAVGVMLYQMLTGEVPRGFFRLPSESGIDPRFDAIVVKALEANRDERYQSALEVRHALDEILTAPQARNDQPGTRAAVVVRQSAPASPGMPKWIAGVTLTVLLVIGIAVVIRGGNQPKGSPRDAQADFATEVAAATPERQMELVGDGIYALNHVHVKLVPKIDKGVIWDVTVQRLSDVAVPDLSPLAALTDLRNLDIRTPGTKDLAWTRGMKLEVLHVSGGVFTDLHPLRRLPLHHLDFKGGAPCDYAVLAGMQLRSFCVYGSPVHDVAFLQGMPVNNINLTKTGFTDWSAVRGLELIEISGDLVPERDAEFLRGIPTLQKINGKPAAEFFAGIAGKSAPAPVSSPEVVERNGFAAQDDWRPVFTRPEDFGGNLKDVEFRDGAVFIKGRTVLAPGDASDGAIRATLQYFDSDRTGTLTLRSTDGARYGEESYACSAFMSAKGTSVVVMLRDKGAGLTEPQRQTFPLTPAIKEGETFTLALRAENGQITVLINGKQAGTLKDTWTTGTRRFGLTPSNVAMTEFRDVAVRAIAR